MNLNKRRTILLSLVFLVVAGAIFNSVIVTQRNAIDIKEFCEKPAVGKFTIKLACVNQSDRSRIK